MPDLVIKPTAGAGNKLILQDQGGGSIFTASSGPPVLNIAGVRPSAPITGQFYYDSTVIDWAGGTGPDITTGADKVDIFSFTSYDNGTTWYGAIVGQEFS